MLFELIVYAFALITVAFAISMFFVKKLLHAAVLLALVSIGSAIMFALTGSALVGVFQLLVFVGGLSTYFIVAFGSEPREEKLPFKKELARLALFALSFIAISGAIAYGFAKAPANSTTTAAQAQENSFISSLTAMFNSDYVLLYVVLLLLVAVATGSIIIAKKVVKLVV